VKEYIRIFVFVIALGSVSALLLAGVEKYTRPLVFKVEELRKKMGIMDVLGVPYDRQGAEEIFSKNVRVENKGGYEFYIGRDGSIAFEFSGSGLWGPIRGLVALEGDKKTIKGIKIMHEEETPGLGGRIEEEGFLAQFRGKSVYPALVFVTGGGAKGANEVDAITGATITSRALEDILNTTIKNKVSLLGD